MRCPPNDEAESDSSSRAPKPRALARPVRSRVSMRVVVTSSQGRNGTTCGSGMIACGWGLMRGWKEVEIGRA